MSVMQPGSRPSSPPAEPRATTPCVPKLLPHVSIILRITFCLVALVLWAIFPVSWSYRLAAAAALAVVTFVAAQLLPYPPRWCAERDIASWIVAATVLPLILGPGLGAIVTLILMLTVIPLSNDGQGIRRAMLISTAAAAVGLLSIAIGSLFGTDTPIATAWRWETIPLALASTGLSALILAGLWTWFGDNDPSLRSPSPWLTGAALGAVVVTVMVCVFASSNLVLLTILVEAILLALLAQRQLSRSQHEAHAVIESLRVALLERDPYTYDHSVRVAQYVAMMLDELPGISAETKEAILNAARMHDLGKVAIPDHALGKAGKLSQTDWALMQRHPQIGEHIVRPLHAYRESATLVRHHHERWDGSGYPDGLAGRAIPFGSRLIAVADAFDAMTTDRTYRPALPVSIALDELRRQAGHQFDPAVVHLFERSLRRDYAHVGANLVELDDLPASGRAGAAD